MRVFVAIALLGGCGRIAFDPEGKVSTDAVAVDVIVDTVSMNAPVGWWKFDDGVGVTAADSSGNQNIGTLVPNGPTWTTGKSNGALGFDGVDDWVDIANEASFDFERTDSFTLAAWVQTVPAGGDNTILNKFFPSTYTGYWLSLLGGNSVAFTLNGTSAGQELRVTTASGSLATGAWHHVAVTYAGTSVPSGIHIYIDGVDQALSAPSNSLASSILNDNTIRIGAYPPGGVFYIGGLDDVRIYNFVLSESDVQLLAN